MKKNYLTKIKNGLKGAIGAGLFVTSFVLTENTIGDLIKYNRYQQLSNETNSNTSTRHKGPFLYGTYIEMDDNMRKSNAELARYYKIRGITGAGGAAGGFYLGMALLGSATKRKEESELENIINQND